MPDKKKELTDKEKNDIAFRNAVVDRLSSLEKRKRIAIKGLKGLQGLQSF